MKKRVLFIINPISGVGKQKTVEKAVEKYLDKNIEATFSYTQKAGHATEISAAAIGKYDVVVATGGDGTINETASPLIGTETVLAVIPTGSGNGFARHLKIPLTPSKAVQKINKHTITKIDTATINRKKFVNVAGIGFDAHIAHEFATFGQRGFFPYFALILKKFAGYKPLKYTITVDGTQFEQKAFLMSFANSSQFGFNAQIAPKAQMTDGRLELTILKKFPLIAAPALVTRLFVQNIDKSMYIKYMQFKHLRIDFDGNQIYGHTDGEPCVFDNTIEVTIVPSSLNVLV